MILIMTIEIIMTMMIISAEKRKQMIMGIHIIMTKTVVRNPALLEEILLNVRMQKMKNKVNRKMKILQKRIKALPLTPILQEITMEQILTLAMKTMTMKTQIAMKRMAVTMMVITTSNYFQINHKSTFF